MAETAPCAPPIPFSWIDPSVVVPEKLGIPLVEAGSRRLYSLQEWLQDSQYTDDEVFDCEDFHYAKQNGFAGFRRFQSFEEFSTWLQIYHDNQLCQNEERPVAAERGVSFSWCPEVPTPPEEIVEHPPAAPSKPKLSKKAIAKKAAPSGFSIQDNNRWLGKEQKTPPLSPEEAVVDTRPSHRKTASPLALEDVLLLEKPKVVKSQGFSYDPEKRIVTLKIRGCFFNNLKDRRCVARWPYFILHLQNLNRPHLIDAKKMANEEGWVTVRIPVEPGEEFRMWGSDPDEGYFDIKIRFRRISYIISYYRISEAGEIIFVREELHL